MSNEITWEKVSGLLDRLDLIKKNKTKAKALEFTILVLCHSKQEYKNFLIEVEKLERLEA